MNVWHTILTGPGAQVVNSYGTYGSLGVPDSQNVPGARFLSAMWKTADNNVWIFGGYGYAATGLPGNLDSKHI